MRTIGQFLKEARVKKKFSPSDVEDRTKIKRSFIEAIEKEYWSKLPEYPVLQGFVRNIASCVGVDKDQALALLRRDYPPKSLRINPKPDVTSKFLWSPRLTFITGVFIVTIAIIGYLIYQYINFVRPPRLIVNQPKEGVVVSEDKIEVKGITNPDATVTVNNQPVLVEDGGEFSAEVEIFEGTSELVITAKSRSGKETVIHRKILPEIKE